jgi:hypothetical protein
VRVESGKSGGPVQMLMMPSAAKDAPAPAPAKDAKPAPPQPAAKAAPKGPIRIN